MRSSTTICVDANLVVKLFVPQPSPHVINLWAEWKNTQASLVAPSLIFYEATNALYQMTRHGELSHDSASSAISAMPSLPIQIVGFPGIHQRAPTIAIDHGLKATYDTYYLALSEHLGCELWTTGKRLFNAIRHTLDWIHFVDES